jgi:hypothetical protein
MNINNKGLWIFAAIAGIALIITGFLITDVIYKIKSSENSIAVTGSAKKNVTSDLVKWTGSFSRNVDFNNLKSGYTSVKKDLDAVKTYLKTNGINDDTYTVSPVSVENVYSYKQDGGNQLVGYTLKQNIIVQSADLQKITKLAQDVTPIINQGIIFSTQSLEYFYTKLPEARVELLAEATKDAKNRAEKIAQSTGSQVAALRSASAGVIQVLQPNSTDVSDYGSYDTSTIEKEITAVIRVSFSLK